MWFPALVLAVGCLCVSARGAEEAPERPGRFLFAGDDDWDWASRKDAAEPCKLARYGRMEWSALDWAEEGLPEVRGALIGVPPDPKKTMSLEELSDLRGEKATYRHHEQKPGVVKQLLEGEEPPNVIILMQNLSKAGSPSKEDVKELLGFLRAGGRLVVLDEWKKYHDLLDAVVTEARTLPPGPPIEAPPAPAPLVEEKPAEQAWPDPPALDPSDAERERRKQFEALLPGLADDTYRVREEASAAIRALGTEVLPWIEEVESDDPEVRHRLREIREDLRPKPQKRKVISQEERDARRLEKHQRNVALVRTAATNLREARIPHLMDDVLVDKEKRPLPSLRIEFPSR